MISKLCRVVTYDEGNSLIVSHDSLTTNLREVTWQTKKPNFFLCATTMTTKLGRIDTYNEENLPIISHHLVTTWSYEVT